MPGNFFAADISYPDLSKYDSTEAKLEAVQNYLFLLLETLRYTLRNLSMEENFNEAELADWVENNETLKALIAEYVVGDTVISNTVITDELYSDYGAVADLTVRELRTDYTRAARYLAGNTGNIDYLYIHDEEISFITAIYAGGTEQLHHGSRCFFWRDDLPGVMTSEAAHAGAPVMVYTYTEQVKARFSFIEESDGNGGTWKVPKLKFGAGSDAAGVKNTASLIKHPLELELSYTNTNGKQIGVWQRNSGYMDLVGLRKPTELDFSGFTGGVFTETLDGGGVNRYGVSFDAQGRPSAVTDAEGHRTAVVWT